MIAMDESDWKRIRSAGATHPVEAYAFVRRGLEATLRRLLDAEADAVASDDGSLHGSLGGPEIRHLSGQQLCLGLREAAIDEYGMMARPVLRHWGVTRTEDFGRIVYTMIAAGILASSPDDRIEDFAGVYDFEEAFSPAAIADRMVGAGTGG
ncbi:MAG: Minf_1886 family protein [Planctomycetota bacterium]